MSAYSKTLIKVEVPEDWTPWCYDIFGYDPRIDSCPKCPWKMECETVKR